MLATNVRVALLCLLGLLLPACAQQPRSGPTPSREVFAREWLGAWNSHDVDRILSFYTDDAFYEDVPSVDNGWAIPLRGHPMIRDSLVETFADMPDLAFELESVSEAGDRMVVEWIMTGTRYRDHTGKFSIRAVSVVRLEGDKVAWVRDYYDAYRLLSQLGIVPSVEPEQPKAGGDSASR